MHNSERMVKGRERCTLLINSKDADNLNLTDGQNATVTSNVGEVKLPVEITDNYDARRSKYSTWLGTQSKRYINISIAQEHAGVSLNDLTNNMQLDTLTGNADFSGTRVKIKT